MHAYPTLGRRQLVAISRSDIQIWVKERSDVLTPGSVELVYRWVATIFKAAVADRLLAASPCERIALPKKDRHEIVPLAVHEHLRAGGTVPLPVSVVDALAAHLAR